MVLLQGPSLFETMEVNFLIPLDNKYRIMLPPE